MASKNLGEPRFGDRAVTYSVARAILMKNMMAETDMPTCFIGPPGVGKTALVEDVAREIKANLCVIPLSCYDASELKGIPRVVQLEDLRKTYPDRVKDNGSGFVTYYAHNFEFPATDNPDLWIFFFDEFNTVAPSTQVPIFQATQKRCITGSYRFPKQNRIVLAGNRPKDSEAVQPIPSPIISRVNLHELKFDAREWLTWGAANGIHPAVLAFIQANPSRLCYFTEEIVQQVQPYPTPRTWEYASTILRNAYTDQQLAGIKKGKAVNGDTNCEANLWNLLESHLAGSIGHETIVFRDSDNKCLLDYVQSEAASVTENGKPTTATVRRLVQAFEDDKKNGKEYLAKLANGRLDDNQARATRTALIRILEALPEIEPAHAAVFLRRVKEFCPLTAEVLNSRKDITAKIKGIPALMENLVQLK